MAEISEMLESSTLALSADVFASKEDKEEKASLSLFPSAQQDKELNQEEQTGKQSDEEETESEMTHSETDYIKGVETDTKDTDVSESEGETEHDSGIKSGDKSMTRKERGEQLARLMKKRRQQGKVKQGRVSKSKKAGLIFPVDRISKELNRLFPNRVVQTGAAVFAAAVLEYLAAINKDEELHELLRDVIIAHGGTVPHIQPELSKELKKTKKVSTSSADTLISDEEEQERVAEQEQAQKRRKSSDKEIEESEHEEPSDTSVFVHEHNEVTEGEGKEVESSEKEAGEEKTRAKTPEREARKPSKSEEARTSKTPEKKQETPQKIKQKPLGFDLDKLIEIHKKREGYYDFSLVFSLGLNKPSIRISNGAEVENEPVQVEDGSKHGKPVESTEPTESTESSNQDQSKEPQKDSKRSSEPSKENEESNKDAQEKQVSKKRKSSGIEYDTQEEKKDEEKEEKPKKKKTRKLTESEIKNVENYHKKSKSLEKARAVKTERKRREKAGEDPSLAKQAVERRMAEEEEARKKAGKKPEEEHIETRYEELPDDEEKREKMLHSLDKSLHSLEIAREAKTEQAKQDKEFTEEEESETDTEYEGTPTPSERKPVKRKASREEEAQGDTHVYLIKSKAQKSKNLTENEFLNLRKYVAKAKALEKQNRGEEARKTSKKLRIKSLGTETEEESPVASRQTSLTAI